MFINFLRKFKYSVVGSEDLFFNVYEDGRPQGKKSLKVLFMVNGFGRRKIKKSISSFSFPLKKHSYYHQEIWPWLKGYTDLPN